MRPFIKGKFANVADLPDVPATANVGNEFNYYDGIAPATAIDKSEGGLPQDRGTLNSGLQLLSKFAVGIQNGEFTLPTFDSRMATAPMTGYSVDSILYYNDVANSVWLVLKSTKDNNTDDFTQNPSYIGTSWLQIGIIPYTLSVLAKPAFQAGQIMFGLWKSLPSASYVWGDAGRQQLNNASVNYPHLVNAITSGLIPYDTIAAWDAAYSAHPDNAVSFWGYDPVNNIIIVPNIPRGYGMTAAGSLANVGTVLQNAAPNITGRVCDTRHSGPTGAFYNGGGSNSASGTDGGGFNVYLDASRSNAAYGRDSTTRVRGDQIQMRVMFYVGAEISPQEASQITAAGVLSDVAALNGLTGQGGATPMSDYVIETATGLTGTGYTNGWYRKYKSGWVKQGAMSLSNATTAGVTVNLPVVMMDANYGITTAIENASNNVAVPVTQIRARTTTTITLTTKYQSGSSSNQMAGSAHWAIEGWAA